MNYDVIVGIEIHLELNTKTKMFSSAPYKYKSEANSCTNEIDLAHPGTLPCVNKEAIRKAISLCLALNAKIDSLIRFDRKNYYYSDLPKGYQITQQFHPIGRNGYLEIKVNGEYKKIRINRIHMEEDTAKQYHYDDYTLIDYNRSGVPLLEIVSEPCIASALEASLYLEKLKLIFKYLDISNVRMEDGEMRCDVNVSLKPKDSNDLGTKVEIKNINSISNVKEAIDYEINRQIELLDNNQEIIQETRRFDDKTFSTISMRKKETNIDYKYFPEPNIPPIRISEGFIKEIKDSMSEMPDIKYRRYIEEYKLNEYDTNVLLNNRGLSLYFEEAMKYTDKPKTLCNLLTSELVGLLFKDNKNIEDSPVIPQSLAELVDILDNKEISSKQVKELLEKMYKSGKSAKEIIKEENIRQIANEDELLKIIKEVLAENPKSIEDYKNGKDRAFGFMIGHIMKKTKGEANPKLTSDLLTNELLKR